MTDRLPSFVAVDLSEEPITTFRVPCALHPPVDPMTAEASPEATGSPEEAARKPVSDVAYPEVVATLVPPFKLFGT
ncbi:hypothetical protein CHCC14566_4681 [Bacillus licheniformis]|nr:hypothetical protein CHCC14566_4681 [Bacillus licheniformis]